MFECVLHVGNNISNIWVMFECVLHVGNNIFITLVMFECVLHVANNISKPGPQSRALCGAVCALSIAMVLY